MAYPSTSIIPTITLSGVVSAPPGSLVTISATVSGAGSSYIIYWMNHGIVFTTTTLPDVIYTKVVGIDTITALIVPISSGCYDYTTSSGHIVATATTGISEIGKGDIITIYPDPATTAITLSNNNKIRQVTIYSLLGQTVFTHLYDDDQALVDVAYLPAGMYLVKVNNAEIRRFVKQ